jgi:hypothetical protein
VFAFCVIMHYCNFCMEQCFSYSEAHVTLAGSNKARAKKAGSLPALFDAVDKRNFFVVVPVASKLSSRTLNGTRITLAVTGTDTGALHDVLLDFSICSASTPERFLQFEEEIHFVFERLLDELEKFIFGAGADRESDISDSSIDSVLAAAMDLFYYWVNFAPIARGTSATGYASLYSSVLAAGHVFTEHVPANTQLDWEAILSTKPEQFAEKVVKMLKVEKVDPKKHGGLSLNNIWLFNDPHTTVNVTHLFPTAGDITRALSSVEHLGCGR